MRGFLASSVGVTCAAALALPLALPSPAQAGPSAVTSASSVPGSTQSLPLVPPGGERALGGAAHRQGLGRRDTRPFSLVGVVWDDPDRELRGLVRVRTRTTGTGHWSGWQDVETHNSRHGADPGSAESASGRVRGATAPLWVGASDGVEVRVDADRAEPGEPRRANAGGSGAGEPAAGTALPAGLHLELVDPGGAGERGPAGPARRAGGVPDAVPGAAPAEIGALSRRETERRYLPADAAARVKPYIGARPRIVTRKGWGADERLRERGFVYSKKVKAAFVHHTASGNNYTCSQAPSLIRGIYRYHVVSLGWRDIGYNFLVDKCGTLYEGRAGGVAKAVLGAHTLGFNTDSMGIAVLGSFQTTKPSGAALKAIARLTAWKLGLYGGNPRGKTYLKSGGGNLYRKGKNVRLNVISGHRDGYATECPGRLLYGKLGSARATAARYQGR
ncbi:N-acetylmuramoyl-L-alanine amidase [Streptomyces sp. NPDC048566]|uniref:peptidoglycan recognition protein family protein n=1 Tax=Streptomyces sp. NPDC048566 TaxID=3365569 RepID=UPI003716245A